MGEIVIAPGETKKIVSQPGSGEEYNITVDGADVWMAHDKSRARSSGKRVRPGDRVTMNNLRGKSVYAKNPGDNDKNATLEVNQAGFNLIFQPRPVVGAVATSSGNEAAPANDNEEFAADSLDLDAEGDQTLAFSGVDAAEHLTALADFENDGHVEVHFTDIDGNRLTSRVPADNGDYSVSGGGKVYVTPSIASPYVEVELVDDTADGTTNTADWTVYFR